MESWRRVRRPNFPYHRLASRIPGNFLRFQAYFCRISLAIYHQAISFNDEAGSGHFGFLYVLFISRHALFGYTISCFWIFYHAIVIPFVNRPRLGAHTYYMDHLWEAFWIMGSGIGGHLAREEICCMPNNDVFGMFVFR